MATAGTPSASEPAKDLILVQTVATAKTNDKSTKLRKIGIYWYR